MRMENRAILLTNLTFTFTKSGEKQPKNAERKTAVLSEGPSC